MMCPVSTVMRGLTLLLVTMAWGASAAEPPSRDSESQRRRASLDPPSQERIREGLAPLSAQLPDTRTRPGLLPPDASEGLFVDDAARLSAFRGRDWVPLEYHWVASELRHRPLYFEDAMLERHGQTRHPLIQPLASGSRFFLTFPALPYAMAINPPRPAQSTLGHFRPGSAAPVLLQRPPLQADAALLEAGVWVGFIFLIP